MSQKLNEALGQPFVVENKPGAGGIPAMQSLAQSAPDGYTLGLATISQAVFNRYLFSKLPYDPQNDLVPVATLAGSSFVLVAHAAQKAATLGDLIEQARKAPGTLNIGIPGSASPPHIAALLLLRETGLDVQIVPFKTGPDALNAVLRGDVQLFIDGPGPLVPQIATGTLRPLVVTGSQRVGSLKDVPTLAEAGFPGATAESWMGLVAPRGTPEAVIERLNSTARTLLDDPDYAQKFQKMGFFRKSTTSKEFAALIEAEHRRWGPVLQAANLRSE